MNQLAGDSNQSRKSAKFTTPIAARCWGQSLAARYPQLFTAYAGQFNWRYRDRYPDNLATIFRDVCRLEGEDGLVFGPNSVQAQTIKEGADYEGVRVRFRGKPGNARITVQADIGFGDKVHPDILSAEHPAFFDMPAASLRVYPPETVVAEKAEAMFHLGSLNSRMKDFYDIWRLSQLFDFDGAVLSEAIKQTFKNRGTEFIRFDELKAELLENEIMEKQWDAFLAKTGVAGPASFHEVLDQIAVFLGPLFERIDHRSNLA